MSIRSVIFSEMRAIADGQHKVLAPLTDDRALHDTGLDSLCFAILVSRLEDITGRDPFSSEAGARFPRTVGEFIALYEEALA